jgi:tRNA G18 (ribose-2'-O)-methylase SpoU
MTCGSAGEQLDGKTLYKKQQHMRDCFKYSPAPIIIADDLHIPENIGSVLRLADAVGSQKVFFITEPNEQSLNRIRRTARSCDALVSWQFVTCDEFLIEHLPQIPKLIAIELTNTSTSIFETNLPTQCCLVIGNERHGVSKTLLEQCQQAVHIPMYGVNGSMNVTHALAISLFEWRRQSMQLNMNILSNKILRPT